MNGGVLRQDPRPRRPLGWRVEAASARLASARYFDSGGGAALLASELAARVCESGALETQIARINVNYAARSPPPCTWPCIYSI